MTKAHVDSDAVAFGAESLCTGAKCVFSPVILYAVNI